MLNYRFISLVKIFASQHFQAKILLYAWHVYFPLSLMSARVHASPQASKRPDYHVCTRDWALDTLMYIVLYSTKEKFQLY